MDFSKKVFSLLFLITVLIFSSIPVKAQRGINYEQLANQQRDQNIFFDNFTLPGDQPGTVKFVTTFRIDYNLLPFRKYDSSGDKKNFFSPVGMNIEVFKNPNAPQKKNRRDDFSVEGLEPVVRTAWKDTAFAENYEQTKAKNKFITGTLTSDVKPGTYSYILQFIRGEEVEGQTSRKQTVKIQPYDSKQNGQVILGEEFSNESGSGTHGTLQLLNFGDNVYYGKDFYTFVRLPEYDSSKSYSYKVNRVDITKRDTTRESTVHTGTLKQDQIYRNVRPALTINSSTEYLKLKKADPGYTYAIVKIPNSQFMNAVYQFKVVKEDQDAPVAQSIFRSKWIKMPVSLLNIDVAIDMLRFIADENTIRDIRSGSNAEKEKKFRAFWKKRDPTPNTEYNELLAEYYRRVDYAYEEFSTINVKGYNTDQGKVYIQYGPPKSIDRKFPPGEPAVEIWQYDKRSFVFRAVSGFGEFKLVSD